MSDHSVFSEEKLKEMSRGMSKEDIERYKKQGEHMYSKDYVNDKSPEDKVMENVAYISEGLKSGLLPCQLDNNELELMRSVYGATWYEKYGYHSETQQY